MAKIKTSLLKIIGRINKVKLVRDLILIALVPYIAFLAPALSQLTDAKNQDELNRLFQAQPLLYWFLLAPFAVLGVMLLFIHKIDAWEDAKAEKRHQELLEAIKGIKGDK